MANRHRTGDAAHSSHPSAQSVPAPATPRPRAYRTPVRRAQDDGKNPLVVRLGQLLRRFRVRRCLSQEQLGAISKIDRTHISLLECGTRDPRVTTICALAAALRVNPGELMPVLFLPDKAAIAPPTPSAPATPLPPAYL